MISTVADMMEQMGVCTFPSRLSYILTSHIVAAGNLTSQVLALYHRGRNIA